MGAPLVKSPAWHNILCRPARETQGNKSLRGQLPLPPIQPPFPTQRKSNPSENTPQRAKLLQPSLFSLFFCSISENTRKVVKALILPGCPCLPLFKPAFSDLQQPITSPLVPFANPFAPRASSQSPVADALRSASMQDCGAKRFEIVRRNPAMRGRNSGKALLFCEISVHRTVNVAYHRG